MGGSSLYQWSCSLEQILFQSRYYFSLFSIFFCKRKSMPEMFCVRHRRTQFIIVGFLCFQEWLFWDFCVDRLQFPRRFEWRYTSYAQTNRYDNNRWADNFKRQKRGPKGQKMHEFLAPPTLWFFVINSGFCVYLILGTPKNLLSAYVFPSPFSTPITLREKNKTHLSTLLDSPNIPIICCHSTWKHPLLPKQ